MSSAVIAFRTTDAEVLATWDEWRAEMEEQHGRIRAFMERLDPGNQLRLHVRRNCRPAYLSGSTAPEGWRRNASGNIVPNKRLKAGKAAQAQLDELNRLAPRDLSGRLKGMPGLAFVGNRLYEPGAFKHDGAIYVYWGGVPEDVDPEVWEELKLSEFYAAKEAHDG